MAGPTPTIIRTLRSGSMPPTRFAVLARIIGAPMSRKSKSLRNTGLDTELHEFGEKSPPNVPANEIEAAAFEGCSNSALKSETHQVGRCSQ